MSGNGMEKRRTLWEHSEKLGRGLYSRLVCVSRTPPLNLLSTPENRSPYVSQVNGFTPINLDSHGRVIVSHVERTPEAEPPFKRRRGPTHNPWTPRKPRQRSQKAVRVAAIDLPTRDEHQDAAVDARANTTIETPCLPSTISETTSAKLQRFLYQPTSTTTLLSDAIKQQEAGPSDDKSLQSQSPTPEPATPLRDHRSRFKSWVPPATAVDDTKVQVPATQPSVVPQTPPLRCSEAVTTVEQRLRFPIEGWDDAVDMGWDEEAEDEAEDEAYERCVAPHVDPQGDPRLRDRNTSVQPLSIFGCSESVLHDIESDDTFPELRREIEEEEDNLGDIEDALMSAEAEMSSAKAKPVKLSGKCALFQRSTLPPTPCPAGQLDVAPQAETEDMEDFFGELDDQDVFDMVDVAAQVSAALKKPPSLHALNPAAEPKLRYNPPKEYRKAPSNAPKPQGRCPAPTFKSPMRNSGSTAIHNLIKLEHSLDAPRNPGRQHAVAPSQLGGDMLPSATPTPCKDPHAPAPFMRGSFPKLVKDNSPIEGVSSSRSLRVCFRLGEMFKAVREGSNNNLDIIIELYAKVVHREDKPADLYLTFGDLFFPDKPPYMAGVWRGYRGNSYWMTDAEALKRGAICRALGKVERDLGIGKWVMNVLSAQVVCWDDVEMTRGIVCAQ